MAAIWFLAPLWSLVVISLLNIDFLSIAKYQTICSEELWIALFFAASPFDLAPWEKKYNKIIVDKKILYFFGVFI